MDESELLRRLLEIGRDPELGEFEPGPGLNLLEEAVARLDLWVSDVTDWFLSGDPFTLPFLAETAYTHWIMALCCVL